MSSTETALIPQKPLSQEIKEFLKIAMPMALSFTTDPIMHFFDRLFLSRYQEGMGDVYLSASLSGGLLAFVALVFFMSISGYANPMVAQYYGASKHKDCGNIAMQSLIFSLCIIPILFLASFLIDDFFALFNHSPQQEQLEVQYSRVLVIGGVTAVIRSGIGGFFIGIGKTWVVLLASVVGMIINIPLNYLCIYGGGFIPELGIIGAAVATIVSGLISVLILLFYFLRKDIHEEFRTRIPMKIHVPLMKKLIKFGVPSGIESGISVWVFSFFIAAMSGYGVGVGAAVTIAINWDSMFFIPMMGMGFATTALVGRYMGTKNIAGAIRILKIALGINTLFSLVVVSILVFFPEPLINLFVHKVANKEEVFTIARTMLQLVGLYLLTDGLNLSIASLLRGAGDTKAVMYIFVFIDVCFVVLVLLLVNSQRISPIGGWWIFVGFAMSLSLGMLLRFLQGKWKHMSLVE